MSYNGIGLSSVRGSATSGHVQANRGHVNANRLRRQQERNSQSRSHQRYNPVSATARQQGQSDIQKHEERRRIENELLELQEEMEDAGLLSADEIKARLERERTRLLQRAEGKQGPFNREYRGEPQSRGQRWDRQKTAANQALKTQQNDRLGSALGIQRDSHVEGQAFDRELQEQKKAERQLQLEKEKKLLEGKEKLAKKEAKHLARDSKKRSSKKRRTSVSDSSDSDSSSDESTSSYSSYSSTSSSSRDRKRKCRRSSSS